MNTQFQLIRQIKKKKNTINSLCPVIYFLIKFYFDHIGGALVSLFVSSAVDRGLEARSGKTKDY